MAYKTCISSLAANIAQDCEKPIIGGYTGMGVLIPADKVSFVQDTDNPRKVLSIIASDKVFLVDNVNSQPFGGSTTAGSADSGYPAFVKTMNVRVPMRGADASRDVVEALFSSPAGYVGVFAKKDRVGDGSFEIVGLQQAMQGDIASLTRDENANGGAWTLNLVSTEPFAEVDLVGENMDFSSAKSAFDALVQKATE